VVPKFATISHGAPSVLSNIYFASKSNPSFYFAIGSLLYLMEKCKILLEKNIFPCQRFLFLLDVALPASTRKWFWFSPDCEQRVLAKFLHFLPLGVFALGTHCVFGRKLRIASKIIKCIQHPTSQHFRFSWASE